MGLLTNPQAKRGRGRESWVWARISSDKQVRGAKSIKSFRKIQSKYINQITSHSQDNQQFTSQTVHQSAAPQLPLPNCLSQSYLGRVLCPTQTPVNDRNFGFFLKGKNPFMASTGVIQEYTVM